MREETHAISTTTGLLVNVRVLWVVFSRLGEAQTTLFFLVTKWWSGMAWHGMAYGVIGVMDWDSAQFQVQD